MEPQNTSKEQIDEIIREFVYVFVKKIYEEFEHFCSIMESTSAIPPNESTISAAVGEFNSELIKMVPFAGGPLSYFGKILVEKFNARRERGKFKKIYNIIKGYERNKEVVKEALLKASYEIFCCFENQLLPSICEDNFDLNKTLGIDAAHRFLCYIYQNGDVKMTTKDIVNTIVYNEWNSVYKLKLNLGSPTLKIRRNLSEKTFKIYAKSGLYDRRENVCYNKKKKGSNSERYSFRLKFLEESLKDWETFDANHNYDYQTDLSNLHTDFNDIFEFINSKIDPQYDFNKLTEKVDLVMQNNNKLNKILLQAITKNNGNKMMEIMEDCNETRQDSYRGIITKQYSGDNKNSSLSRKIQNLCENIQQLKDEIINNHKNLLLKLQEIQMEEQCTNTAKSLMEECKMKIRKFTNLLLETHKVEAERNKKFTDLLREFNQLTDENEIYGDTYENLLFQNLDSIQTCSEECTKLTLYSRQLIQTNINDTKKNQERMREQLHRESRNIALVNETINRINHLSNRLHLQDI